MNWTKQQEQVIMRRGRNLLVSAAAGSGKTAVLIARIMALLTDKNAPCDIDRLLVVTSTNAAAGEMMERLQNAIEDRLAEHPDDVHLRRQLLLIHNAQITTIDGFSAFVLREYGVRIGLGSSFRIAAEGEAELLRTETLEQLLADAHAEESPEFDDFVETFAPGKSEQFLSDLILRLYDSAMAMPHPMEWLDRLGQELSCKDPETFLSSAFLRMHLSDAAQLIRRGSALAGENLALANDPAGPACYKKTAEGEQKLFSALTENSGDYTALRSLLAGFKPDRLSSARPSPSEDPSLRNRFRANREQITKLRKQLMEEYFPYTLKTALEFEIKSAPPLLMLLSLTKQFHEAFSSAKRDRGIVDFADLEQLALRILTQEDGSPSDAARELQDRFEHVMIDEYQDSNDLQEALLTAVSRISRGEMNYFNVGDIKQSIYSFRQARPALFLEKYESYPLSPKGPSENERIDLHTNFRSRREVTDTVNLVFSQIMRREAGGIDYDEHSALYPGASYPSPEECGSTGTASSPCADGASGEYDPYQTECMLVYTKDDAFPDGKGLPSAHQLESRAIGERIRTMVRGERIYDKDLNAYRPVRYSDIVILTRSGGAFAEALSRTLTAMDIPVHRTLRKGYFSAKEVRLVLDYLRILDNPRQDIPLAAVLHSAFAGLTAKDLAVIRAETPLMPSSGFYDRVRAYAESGASPAIRETLNAFFLLYDDLRSRSADTPAYELLAMLYERSGFAAHMSAGPGGAQRAANLAMLTEKARVYEDTSFTGIRHFIRYIDHLREYEIDFGESSTAGGEENIVRIMTIHKSKGLEFPVVFVAGLSRKFNTSDSTRDVLIHPTDGIASIYLDYRSRVKAPTLKYLSLKQKILSDGMGEELRVLYVAMTRAQQKLILSMTFPSQDKVNELEPLIPSRELRLPAGLIRKANGFHSVLMPAILRQDSTGVCDFMAKISAAGDGGPSFIPVRVTEMTPSDLVGAELESASETALFYQELLESRPGDLHSDPWDEVFQERFSFRYPYAEDRSLPEKVSVSEIKAAHYRDEEALPLYDEAPVIPYIPAFARESAAPDETGLPSAGPGGAARGSAVHRFLELADYASLPADGLAESMKAAVRSQLRKFTEEGLMSEEESDLVLAGPISVFLSSGLGQRMRAADEAGLLRREQPFTLSLPANEIDPSWPADETVLVQGVIDAYFEEDGGLVLVDYKTDRVDPKDGAAVLKDRYAVQLRAYEKALNTLLDAPVREIFIYSLALGQAIRL